MTTMPITTLLAVIIVLGEWSGVARGLLGSQIYAAGLDVGVVALSVVAGRKALITRRLPSLSIVVILAVAYAVVALVEIANPNVPSLRAGLEGYRKSAFMLLGLMIVVLSNEVDPAPFYKIVALGSIPAFLMATRQFLAPLPVELSIIASSNVASSTFHSGQVLRAFSPTSGPFQLGVLGGSVAIVGLGLALSRSPRWLAVAALAGWALGLSITRANLAAAIVACASIALLTPTLRGRLRAGAFAAVPVAAAVVAALFAVGALSQASGTSPGAPRPGGSAPPMGSTIGGVVRGIEDPLEDKNLKLRFSYWADFLQAVRESPITGYGTSAAADGFAPFYKGTTSRSFNPHSIYFKAALEFGVGGLLLLIGLLLAAGLLAFRALRTGVLLAEIPLAIVIFVVVSGIAGPMLDAYPFNLLAWSSLGWAAVLHKQADVRLQRAPAVTPAA
jgi:O-antigen ligase